MNLYPIKVFACDEPEIQRVRDFCQGFEFIGVRVDKGLGLEEIGVVCCE